MDKWMKSCIYTQWNIILPEKKGGIPNIYNDMMNLEDMLSEICQRRTSTAWFHLYEVFKLVKFIEAGNEIVLARKWEEEKVTCYSMGMKLVIQDD